MLVVRSLHPGVMRVRRRWVVLGLLTVLVALVGFGAGGHWRRQADPGWGAEAEQWLANVEEARREGVPNVAEFLRGDIVLDHRATGGDLAEGMGDSLDLIRHLDIEHPDLRLHALYLGRRGMVVPLTWRGPDPSDAVHAAAVLRMSPDGLVRVDVAPSPRAGRAAGWSADRRRSLELLAAAYAERHGARLDRVPGGRGPAVYGVPGPEPASGFLRAVLLLHPGDDGGCPVRRAVSLALGPGGDVLGVERYVRLGDGRRCLEPERRFEGWWTGMDVPEPVRHELTGTVSAAGTSVEVWNGTPSLEGLAAWALQRYADAGLTVPRPTSLTFYPAADRCLGNLAVAGGEANSEILLCFGAGLACPGSSCPPWSDMARTTMLHELAHTWMTQNLSDGRKAAYADMVGLRWASDEDPWELRAIERAAVVIAWGLHPSAGLPRPVEIPATALHREFRFLTGAPPLTRPR